LKVYTRSKPTISYPKTANRLRPALPEILKPLWPLLEPEYSDKVPGVFPEIDFFAGQGLYPLRRGSRNVLQYRNRVFYQALLKIGCSEMHTIQKNNP
jgi:hypothetical protein